MAFIRSVTTPRRRHARRSRHRRIETVVGLTGGLLLAAGGTLSVGQLFAPQAVERAYGTMKTTTDAVIDTTRERVTGELPTVRLGVSGGVPELDRCDGTFTEMTSYERDGVPPVWAAHNNCDGDAILPWETGQHVRIEGREQIYEIVDIRYTSKIWATTDDLVGLDGDLALQTCRYGEDRMKFIGLRPVTAPQVRPS
jgi:hypothetical protein